MVFTDTSSANVPAAIDGSNRKLGRAKRWVVWTWVKNLLGFGEKEKPTCQVSQFGTICTTSDTTTMTSSHPNNPNTYSNTYPNTYPNEFPTFPAANNQGGTTVYNSGNKQNINGYAVQVPDGLKHYPN